MTIQSGRRSIGGENTKSVRYETAVRPEAWPLAAKITQSMLDRDVEQDEYEGKKRDARLRDFAANVLNLQSRADRVSKNIATEIDCKVIAKDDKHKHRHMGTLIHS